MTRGLGRALFVVTACGLVLTARVASAARPIVFENNGEILVAGPGGGESVTLTGTVGSYDNSVYCYGPTWSPDGRRIAFCRIIIRPDTLPDGRPGPACADCHVVTTDPTGGDMVRLTRLPGHPGVDRYRSIDRLEWSADGRRLGFRWRASDEPGAEKYYVVNADGSATEQLSADEFESNFQPRRRLLTEVSPDGRLRLSSEDAGGAMELFVSGPDGSGRRRLTRTRNGNGSIRGAWSPDGNRVVYIPGTESGGPDRGNVHVIRRDGSGQKQLGRKPVALSELPDSWSPDCRRLAWSEDGYIYCTDFSGSPRRVAVGVNPDWRPSR